MNFYLLHTTYPIVFFSVFARQLCLPVPAILFLLAGGALAGAGRLSLTGILVVAVMGCLLGDWIWFEAGRRRGKRVLKLLCWLSRDPSFCIRHARESFSRRGLRLLLIAKFLPGLDGVTPPLAGMSATRRMTFLLYDAGGAALWVTAYMGIGFLFAAKLDIAVRFISAFGSGLVVALGVPLLFFFVYKLMQLVRMIHVLRPLHITPQELKARLDSNERIGIVDLLRFEDDGEASEAIPGAVRVNPRQLRQKHRISIPDDVELVLYCASKNSFVSARAAAVMRRRGIWRIRILEGGLAAWKACGFPVSNEFADPDSEMKRLGIEIVPALAPLRTGRGAVHDCR